MWKLNLVDWYTIIHQSVKNNILVYDSAADNGEFHQILIFLMEMIMKNSLNGTLTDVFIGEDAHIKTSRTVVPNGTYCLRDNKGRISQLDKIKIHSLLELNEYYPAQPEFNLPMGGGIYSIEYRTTHGASLANNDSHLVVGLDMDKIQKEGIVKESVILGSF